CGEDEWQQSANKESDDHLWFREGKLKRKYFSARSDVVAQFFDIRAKQNQRRQSGRRDRVTFGDGFHRVADRVELIRYSANFFWQLGHHRNAPRVISDRPERVERDNDASHGQHRHHGNGDSIEAGEMKTEQDSDADKANRQSRGMLSDRKR